MRGGASRGRADQGVGQILQEVVEGLEVLVERPVPRVDELVQRRQRQPQEVRLGGHRFASPFLRYVVTSMVQVIVMVRSVVFSNGVDLNVRIDMSRSSASTVSGG